jgi:threonine/homoserine/homoserine lactone efflux protein
VGEAIGQVLPIAVGVALSPLPIVALVLMLVTPRGRANGLAFVIGWLIGLAIIGAIVLSVAGAAGPEDGGEPATWVSALKLLLGLALLAVAVKQFRARPHGDQAAAPAPKWMQALDTFTPVKAAGAGVVLSGANPKNALLAVSAGATIAQAAGTTSDEIVAYAVFALLGTVGVAAPVVIAFALGDRASRILDALQAWMSANNAVIMAVLLLVIGVKLIGDAVQGFAS